MAPRKTKTIQIEKFRCLRQKKKSKTEYRSWSDLPTEILEYIMSGLYLNDITTFHSICKRWRSIEFPPIQQLISYHPPLNHHQHHHHHHHHQIPWLMRSNSNYGQLTSSSELIAPSSTKNKKSYSIKIEGIEGPADDKTQLCSIKFGWLLLSRTHSGSDCVSTTSFFLYSPFINRRIDLPDLNSKFDVATFSSLPTSPDCVFFVLCCFPDKVNISTCRQGEMVWSSKSFSGGDGFSPIKDVVYLKKKFYCSNIRGGLATFDVDQQSWSVLSEPMVIMNAPVISYSNSFLVGDEDDGELFFVLICSSGWVLVHKLDRSEMNWIKVHNLQDKSLFLSSSSTSIVISKNKRTKWVKMNRIYYCLPGEAPRFYSFKAGRNYKSTSHYGDVRFREFPENYFWIEPPY
ncbi:F-box/kelch-repeat protein At1g57790-like [Telopea speciosissima]|uniref:F-box/kelch-repeat protein At1g57790-like n=1 Tax=Telopea speciosissima TaxID=54955 RepID=UPI001CC7BAFC|nr:F-box/kelch-repeat protein At1g57790-like [Telopea speciosissima]